ncbi:unnamed protein product, partial [Effrenium voratum]
QAVAQSGRETDFYAILGVEPGASEKEIKAAYRRAARKSHPDFFRSAPAAEREAVQERFTQVNNAFDVLTDPKKRQAYDLRGLAGLAEFEFNGERIIMPPPWRVRIGRTGHHFWNKKEYFVGFMLETVDVPLEAIHGAYEEPGIHAPTARQSPAQSPTRLRLAQATREPIGVGQAILVDRCTERRAKDIIEALQEYGFACMAEEIPDEELVDAAKH